MPDAPSDDLVVDKPATEVAEPTPDKPSVELRWAAISTADGRGADTSVQLSGGDKLGSRPSVGVRTRNGIEVNHVYLRFDLSSIEGVRSRAEKAGLILTLVSTKPPIGANLRVYGIADVGMWSEDKLDWDQTPSSEKAPKQLSDFELLAELSVDGSLPVDGEGKNQIRISDPRLTKFIADSGDLVTFAIAGEFEDAQLRFISREKNSAESTQLLVEVPVREK